MRAVLIVGNWTAEQYSGTYPPMTDFERLVLIRLYLDSRDTRRPNVERLGQALGAPRSRTAEALIKLQAQGWVDAGRVRLTLAGLAVATSLHARGLSVRDSRAPEFAA